MPSSLTARIVCSPGVLGAILLCSLTAVAGCSAGFEAQTNQPYQSGEGDDGTSGSIAARNVLVTADDSGKGTLHAVLVNTGSTDDRLISISVGPGAEGVRISRIESLALSADQPVRIGTGGQTVAVTGADAGRVVTLTLTFAAAAPITVRAPVLPASRFTVSP